MCDGDVPLMRLVEDVWVLRSETDMRGRGSQYIWCCDHS